MEDFQGDRSELYTSFFIPIETRIGIQLIVDREELFRERSSLKAYLKRDVATRSTCGTFETRAFVQNSRHATLNPNGTSPAAHALKLPSLIFTIRHGDEERRFVAVAVVVVVRVVGDG